MSQCPDHAASQDGGSAPGHPPYLCLPLGTHHRALRASLLLCLLLLIAPPSPPASAQEITLGEALDAPQLPWSSGGAAPWFGQTTSFYAGGDAAQSGAIGSGQESWLETQVNGPGILSYAWRLSFGFTWLALYVDGVRAAQCWTTAWQMQHTVLPAGPHTLRWTWAPTMSGYAGYLDAVSFVPGPALLLLSPNGGETWRQRDMCNITWLSTADVGDQVSLTLLHNGTPAAVIASSTANDGRHTWFVPPDWQPGDAYRVQVSGVAVPAASDASDADFTIGESAAAGMGGALLLDGVDDYADTPDQAELEVGVAPGQSWTLEGWVNLQDLYGQGIFYRAGAYALIIDRDIVNGYHCMGFQLWSATGQVCGGLRCTSSRYLSTGWHHVALVYDASVGQAAAYFDGQSRYSTACAPVGDVAGPLFVGRGWYGNLEGAIDEVRLSDLARYSGSFGPPGGPFTCDEHTRALWHLDEPTGSTVFADACGENNVLSGRNGAHTAGSEAPGPTPTATQTSGATATSTATPTATPSVTPGPPVTLVPRLALPCIIKD